MQATRHLLKVAWGAYQGGRAVATRTPLRLAAFAALALLASWPLLATAPALNDFRDAHVLGHYESFARDALVRWHQAPLWDPYYCGGMYILGTPQARFFSPTFLLTLLFGEARGEALTAFVMMVLGLEGAFRYARSRRSTAFSAMLAAPVFGLSGLFAIAPELGWIGFYGFELMPWIALGVRRALKGERVGVLMAAVSAAWCVGFGGTYAAPIAALWCAFELVEWIVRRGLRRAPIAGGLGAAAAAALLGAGLAAVRLWPIADTLRAAPRVIGGSPGNTWSVLGGMLFLPRLDDTEHGAFFVGAAILPAVLLGLTRRRALPLALAAVLWCWLAAGYEVHASLFDVLRELPVYSTLRYPERFLVPTALVLSALAALGGSTLEARARMRSARRTKRRRLGVNFALALASLAFLVNLGPELWQHVLHADARGLIAPPVEDAEAQPFRQARGNRWALAYYEPMNRGSSSRAGKRTPSPQSPRLRGDRVAEEWVVEPGAGTVETPQRWSCRRPSTWM